MRNLVVQKFGGTSVGSLDRIAKVAQLISDCEKTEQNVVVVSAMAGQTNKLIEMAYELSSDPPPEAYDMLLASGEQVSCALLSIALQKLGKKAIPLLGFQVGIETDDLFTKARIQNIRTDILKRYLDKGIIPVIAGFQGVRKTETGETFITTLGRGGSDTSAVAIAAALKAERCDIFTDVAGVFSADPRIVPEAKVIKKITFTEMMELASLGAKVLHMRSVELAAKFDLVLRVLSTFDPNAGSTTIVKESAMLESPIVSSITTDSAECLLALKLTEEEAKFPAKFLRPLADAGINVDVIVKTAADASGICSINFTVPRDEGLKSQKILSAFDVRIDKESVVKLSVVGIGMRTHSGVAAKMFESLEKLKVPVHLITTSEIKISVLIEAQHRELAMAALHDAFELA